MINLTSRLHHLFGGADLHHVVSSAIVKVTSMLEESEGRPASHRDYQSFAFATMYRGGMAPRGMKFDERFLDAVFEFAQVTPPDFPKEALKTLKAYSIAPKIPVSGLKSLRRGAKLLLVELWHQNALLLPTVFNAGPGFEVGRFSCPLVAWVRAFPAAGEPGDRRLFYFGQPPLLAQLQVELLVPEVDVY
jgi:hypothetical protein